MLLSGDGSEGVRSVRRPLADGPWPPLLRCTDLMEDDTRALQPPGEDHRPRHLPPPAETVKVVERLQNSDARSVPVRPPEARDGLAQKHLITFSGCQVWTHAWTVGDAEAESGLKGESVRYSHDPAVPSGMVSLGIGPEQCKPVWVWSEVRAVPKNPTFFLPLRTGPKDHQPPTANRHQTPNAKRQPPLNPQPSTATNHQQSTADRHQPSTIVQFCFCGFVSCPCLGHEAESVPVNVRFLLASRTLFPPLFPSRTAVSEVLVIGMGSGVR